MKIIERFGGLILALTVIAVTLLLGSCDQREPIVPTFDRTGLVMEVRINTYDNLKQVHDVYREVHDLPRAHDLTGLQGFAVWYEFPNGKPEDELYTCEIHIARPARVDDSHTLTLGHEMLHCVYGSYHRNKH